MPDYPIDVGPLLGPHKPETLAIIKNRAELLNGYLEESDAPAGEAIAAMFLLIYLGAQAYPEKKKLITAFASRLDSVLDKEALDAAKKE